MNKETAKNRYDMTRRSVLTAKAKLNAGIMLLVW